MRINPNAYFLLFFFSFKDKYTQNSLARLFTKHMNTAQCSYIQLHLEPVLCQSNKQQATAKPLATVVTKHCGFGSGRGQ